MSTKVALNQAIKLIGLTKLAKSLGVSYQSIKQWRDLGRMPHTEYSCATNHSIKIEEETNGKVTVENLLGHLPTCIVMQREKIKNVNK